MTDADRTIRAPWDDATVEQLNLYQKVPFFHPYTCPREHPHQTDLLATTDGWVCPQQHCGYTQDWAHASSVSGLLQYDEETRTATATGFFFPPTADPPAIEMRYVSLDIEPSMFPGEPPHLVGDDGLTGSERADLAAVYDGTAARPPAAWFPRHMVGVVPGCVGHGHQHTDDICTEHGWAIIDPGEDDPPILETHHLEIAEYVVRLWNREFFSRTLEDPS